MQVIGAGFGRTGTLSLKAALEALGFGPCYHMAEVRTHPEHIALWQAAGEGQAIDWDTLFAGYAAAVDWPACTFYEQLMRLYPEAKVVLTVREPERWYESAQTTIYEISGPHAAAAGSPMPTAQLHMIDTIIWQGTFGGRFEDKQHAIAVFEKNIQEVKERVPRERLLVFDVREGWAPLCRFLQVPLPEGPFPRLNEAQEFRQRMEERRRAGAG
jgi:hypothetical protein